jgi:hypothetical protein
VLLKVNNWAGTFTIIIVIIIIIIIIIIMNNEGLGLFVCSQRESRSLDRIGLQV